VADWDQNSPELAANLEQVLSFIRDQARHRSFIPTVQDARRWHREIMDGLLAPDERFVGAFRGETGLEKCQVRVGDVFGVAAPDVANALAQFERTLQRVVRRLDELIPSGVGSDADQHNAVMEVCAWVHAEWVRIHPFANGNGRTARLWANSLAMRYGLPPFVRLRPRPNLGYGSACAFAMRGSTQPMMEMFRRLLAEFISESESERRNQGTEGRGSD
jgi:Fic family protein